MQWSGAGKGEQWVAQTDLALRLLLVVSAPLAAASTAVSAAAVKGVRAEIHQGGGGRTGGGGSGWLGHASYNWGCVFSGMKKVLIRMEITAE